MKRIVLIGLLVLVMVGTASAANMLQNSSQFNATVWTKLYTTTSMVNDTTATTDPTGGYTADRIRFVGATSQQYYIAQATSILTGYNYTFKFDAKPYDSGLYILQLTGGESGYSNKYFANYNLSAGTVTRSYGANATIASNGSGWYTISLEVPATATGSYNSPVICSVNNNETADRMPTYTSTTSYLYLWGGSMEYTPPASPSSDSITLSSPNGGESWQRGTSQTVSWVYSGSPGSTVNLTLLKAGSDSGTITASTSIGSGGAGNYTWNIYGTGTTGNDYTVRITSNDNTSINDSSNSYFTLTSASSAPAGIPENRWMPPGYYFTPSDSIWYQRVDSLGLHPSSAAWLQGLKNVSNTKSWGSSWALRYNMSLFVFDAHEFFVVNSSVTKQLLRNNDTTSWSAARDCDYGPIPIPSGMTTMVSSTDHTVLLVDTSDNVVYEIYDTTVNGTGWNGRPSVWNMSSYLYRFSENVSGFDNGNRWLGHQYWDRVSNSPRQATTPTWYMDMASVPLMPTLLRKEEVDYGTINHAIAITINLANGTAVWPAMGSGHWGDTTSDGWRNNTPPAGAYLRLKSSVNLAARGLSPKARVVATALKQYGGVVTDNGAFYPINVIGANNSVWTAADKTDLNTLKYLTVDDFEFVNVTPLMVDRYSMQVVGASGTAPTASFYINGTADDTYGVATDNKYNGTTIGGNYDGASDYPYYSAGVDANPLSGSYMGTTVTSRAELLAALSGSESGDVVYVSPTANIDMGATLNTIIPAGVTLASNRHGTTDATDGGRIYTTTVGSGWQGRVFQTGGDGVRITGIKIEGESYPENYSPPSGEGDTYRTGLTIYHNNVTVDNCDWKGFAYANIVSVNIPTAGRPWIHHNYIHESQNRHEGYGVEVQGGDALVEGNVFYKNRHDIAAYGLTDEKYTFQYNRILDTGTWDVIGMAHVDAHGSESTGEEFSGARYDIIHNSFYGGHSAAIHQRGYPSDGMYISNNNILTDGAYTGVTGSLPIYQTYVNPTGYGHVYPTYNQYKGTLYNGGQGVLAYQDKDNPTYWTLSTDVGTPAGSSVPGGMEPVDVIFTDTSTGTAPLTYVWNRTNILSSSTPQTFSTSQDPGTVTFYAGNWSIQLVATNAYGSSTTTANTSFINVTGATTVPTANFTADNTTPSVGQTVTFTDSSTGSPTSWLYEFTPPGSAAGYFASQNISIHFTVPGNYTVSLRATNAAGSNTFTRTNYITVNTAIVPPVADFTPKGTYGSFPLDPGHYYYLSTFENDQSVTFMDSSTGGTGNAWNWSFQKADGTWLHSSVQNPVVVFNTTTFGTGMREIWFNVSNEAGYSRIPTSSELMYYFQVSPPPVIPVAQYYIDNSIGTQILVPGSGDDIAAGVGTQVKFTDASLNSPTEVMWVVDYGNGTTQTSYVTPFNITVPTWMSVGGYLRVYFNATNTEGTNSIWGDPIRVADTAAPASLTGITNQTGVNTVIWNWTQASDVAQIRVWKDGVLFENVTSNGTVWTGLSPLTAYQIATKTIDSDGNINATFVNATTTTLNSNWTFTDDGTFTVPVGVTQVVVKMVGGGSSGAGAYMSPHVPPIWGYGGLGGNPGAYDTFLLDVNPGDVWPIVVGKGGANKTSSNVSAALASGNAGGSTTAFGHTVSGGASPANRYPTAESSGGNATSDGVWSTARFALNGTGEGVAGGICGLGYGAPGGGAGTYSTTTSYGGRGANGTVIIEDTSYSTTINIPDFEADQTSANPSTLIRFTDLSTITDTGGLVYNWSFGDGYYSDTIGDVQHVYSYSGTYDVSLGITTSNGTVTEKKSEYISIFVKPTTTTFWSPQNVEFLVLDSNRAPLTDTHVSAVAIESTLPGGITGALQSLENLYGVSEIQAATMLSSATIMNGTTDSMGKLSFVMLPTIGYNVMVLDADGTNFTTKVYPKDTYYIIKTNNATYTQPHNAVSYYSGSSYDTLNVTEPNVSYITMHLYYYDAQSKTDLIQFWVQMENNHTYINRQTTVPAGNSGPVHLSYTVPNIRGDQWRWGYDAHRI